MIGKGHGLPRLKTLFVARIVAMRTGSMMTRGIAGGKPSQRAF
jgi:hypothetical protein